MSIPISIAADFVLNSLIKLAESSARIRAAQAEGRGLTQMEWHDIVRANDQARSDAQAAVDNAIIEGR
jgi:hypothetical protein